MKINNRFFIRDIIDYFVAFHKFDFSYDKEKYLKLFKNGQFEAIALDFLKRCGIETNIKIIMFDQLSTDIPSKISYGYIKLRCRIKKGKIITPNFSPSKLKRVCFKVNLRREIFDNFEEFILTLSHELAHIVIIAKHSKRFKDEELNETITDLFIMSFGLHEEMLSLNKINKRATGYITTEEIKGAYSYIEFKKNPSLKSILKIAQKITP